MAKMDIITCRVSMNFGTEKQNLDVFLGPIERVTVAEAVLIQAMHESDANPTPVHEVRVIDREDRSMRDERQRLLEKYGPEFMQIFPGTRPILPTRADEAFEPDQFASGREEAVAKSKEKAA